MTVSRQFVWFATSILLLCARSGGAEENQLPAVVQKWRAASTHWKTLQADVTCWYYDDTFETAAYQRGTLYLEQNGNGRLELLGSNYEANVPWGISDRTYRSRKCTPYIMIWKDGNAAHLDTDRREVRIASAASIHRVRSDRPPHWHWHELLDNFVAATLIPEEHVPFVCNRDAIRFSELYMFTVSDSPQHVVAKPRNSSSGDSFRIIFDEKTNLATAVLRERHRVRSVVHLTDLKLDETIASRECLLDMQPDGYELIWPTKCDEPAIE